MGTALCAGRRRGGRLDHTLSNLQLLYDAALRGEEAVLLGGYNQVRVLLPGRYDLPRQRGWKLSLLAYSRRRRAYACKEWNIRSKTRS